MCRVFFRGGRSALAAAWAAVLMAVIVPFSARAGLSDCTEFATQLLEPEQEQVIAVKPGEFEIGDFVGGDRFFQIIFRCKDDNNAYKWGVYQDTHPGVYLASIPNVYWSSAAHFPVFTTTQLETLGLGFTGYYYSASYAGHWEIARGQTFNNTYQTHAIIFDPPLPIAIEETGHFYPRVNFRYRFIKINSNLDVILNNTITVHPLAIPIGAFGVIDDQGYTSPTGTATAHMPTLNIVQRACTPFVQNTVSLPSVDAAELPNVGDSGQPTSFKIAARCPHNVARLGYYVESVHGYENEANGVIKIDPAASTAKGIGLQITTNSRSSQTHIGEDVLYGLLPVHQPVKFGPTNRYGTADVKEYNVQGNPLTDESDYIFPHNNVSLGINGNLKVAVYRTGNLVPGSYTAGLTVYMVYR